jgi:outer membrane protein TolC
MLLASFYAVPAAAGLSYDEALATAEARAPELSARRHAIDGAQSASVAAGALPDPKLALGLDNVPINGPDALSLGADFMTMRRIGVMQDVPNAAKRRARSDAAAAMTERERSMFTVEQLMVRRDTALAWLRRYYLERRLALLDELERENQLLIKTTQAQIAGGHGALVDSTMARQELVLLEDRRDELVRQLGHAKAALARFVGSAAHDTLVGDSPTFTIDPESLRTRLHRHPELAVFDPLAAQAAAEAREAQAEKRPDWGVGLAYLKRGPAFSDMAMIEFNFDLPLFSASRQDPRIAAKVEAQARIADEREAMLRKHTEELETWLADHVALSRKLKRTQETWVPLTREKANLMLAAYRAGRGELTPTLMARRELIEARMKEIELEAELRAISAKLAYLYAENHQ